MVAQKGEGLNRTSVGLKRTTLSEPSAGMTSLNRTSVGLKLAMWCVQYMTWWGPQSNQRGIET